MSEFIEAVLLGLLQGVTEFLPVSSSGHLALAGFLFEVEGAGLTLNVLLHAGTFFATALVLRDRLLVAMKEGLHALLQPRRWTTTQGGKDALFIVVASVPTAAIGLGFRDTIEAWTLSPLAVGFGFLLTALLLLATLYARSGELFHPSVGMALLAGLAQGIAVVPGVSRSGSTIAVLLFLGVERGRAFELSMLMSLPVILGAVLLEAPRALSSPSGLSAALVGALVAFTSGVAALLLLRRIVTRGAFPWFAFWVAPLAFATLAMALAWPRAETSIGRGV